MKKISFLRFVKLMLIVLTFTLVENCLTNGYYSHADTINNDDLLCSYFPDKKNGWTAGRWGTIFKTTDGGKKWELVNAPTEKTLIGIHFIDDKNGWVVGESGTILKTIDGGKSWIRQKSPVPFYLMDVFFTSKLKGWIVTERTHILSTDNGGSTWEIKLKDEDLILKAVSFADSLNGWAVGEYGYIYHTKNGGETWSKQGGYVGFDEEKMEIIGDPFLFDVEAVDKLNVWAVGIDGQIITTHDGGNKWEKINIGAPKVQLFCVSSNKNNLIMIGGKKVFYISKDKGKTWSEPRFDPSIEYGWLYDISRIDDSHFLTVGYKSKIYKSNSVDHWKLVDIK